MNEQEKSQELMRLIWELHISIKQDQLTRVTRQKYNPGFPFLQMELMINALLDKLEKHVDAWVDHALDRLAQLRGPQE